MENYEVIKAIGKGSMGEVHLVKCREDTRLYVMKKVTLESKEQLKDSQHEVQMLSTLSHPNIVEFKESFVDVQMDNAGKEHPCLCLVMAYCQGGDLFTRLQQHRKTQKFLSEKQVLDWFIEITCALHHMHKKKILHRDLKTQNIFLDADNHIKLGDFGIARILENEHDMAKTMVGTPYYMSPELFEGKAYNHKSDMWALGCCLHEMATLNTTFNAKEMPSLVVKVLKSTPPSLPNQYSRELQELVRTLLNKIPSKRPSCSTILKLPLIKKHLQFRAKANIPKENMSNSSQNIEAESVPTKKEGTPVSKEERIPLEQVENIQQQLEEEENRKKQLENKLKEVKQAKLLKKDQLLRNRRKSESPLPSQMVRNRRKSESPMPSKLLINQINSNERAKSVKRPSHQDRIRDRQLAAQQRHQMRRKSIPKLIEVEELASQPTPEQEENPFAARNKLRRTMTSPSVLEKSKVQDEELYGIVDSGRPSNGGKLPQKNLFLLFEDIPTHIASKYQTSKDEDDQSHVVEKQIKETEQKITILRDSLNIWQAREENNENDCDPNDMFVYESLAIESSSEEESEEEVECDEQPHQGTLLMRGSLSQRINGILQMCIDGLGNEVFRKVYDYMVQNLDTMNSANHGDNNSEHMQYLRRCMGASYQKYVPLIEQLIFCEQSL